MRNLLNFPRHLWKRGGAPAHDLLHERAGWSGPSAESRNKLTSATTFSRSPGKEQAVASLPDYPPAPGPVAIEVDLGPSLYAKITNRLIPFLFLCYVCSYLDRVNVGFAKLQMLSDLKFSETVYGLGAGIFFVGYVLFEVPSNLIMYRVGARVWIGRIMVTWGLISSAMMFVSSETSFYLLRFLLGAAEAGFIPAVLFYLTYWFPSHRRAKVTALFLMGIPVSGILGGPVSGWILHSLNGSLGLAGWKWLFLLEGIPATILGVIALFYLDNTVDSAKWLRSEEKKLIKANLTCEAQAKEIHSLREGFLNRRVWLIAVTYFFFTMGLYGVSFWLPSIIKASGVKDPLNVGLLTAIPYAAGMAAMILVSRSSDHRHERRWHLAIPGVVGAVGLILSVAYAHNTVFAMAALTIASMGILTTISQYWTIPPAILAGAAAAAGIAIANSIGSIAGLVSPYLLGWIKDLTRSTNIGVEVLALSLLVGGALVFVLPARIVNR